MLFRSVTEAEIKIKQVEPLLLPIFNHGDPSGRGLIGVNKMAIDLNFNNIDQQWLSGDTRDVPGKFPGDLAHSITATVDIGVGNNNGAALHYTILEPKELPRLPVVNIYSCKKITVEQLNAPPMAVGLEVGIPSQNINVSTIPERIYIFVAELNDDRQTFDTDTFCRIDSLSFQFNSGGYQFSSANTEELYQMSREAGLKMTLPQWRDHVGSVCCIDFTKNVNMGLDAYPGMIGSLHLNFKVGATKLHNKSTADMKLWVVIVEEAMATIKDQSMEYNTGTMQVSPLDVPVRYRSYEQRLMNPYGGLSFDDIKRFGRRALDGIQRGVHYAEEKIVPKLQHGYEIAKHVAPYVATAAKTILPLLMAAGMSEAEGQRMIEQHGLDSTIKKLTKKAHGGSLQGGMKFGGKAKKGGKLTSRSEMSRYLE